MQRMEHIDAAARRLQRIKATLGMVAAAGLDSSLSSVMEVNGLIRQEVNAALEELEAALSVVIEPALAPVFELPTQAPGMSRAIVELRPSPRA